MDWTFLGFIAFVGVITSGLPRGGADALTPADAGQKDETRVEDAAATSRDRVDESDKTEKRMRNMGHMEQMGQMKHRKHMEQMGLMEQEDPIEQMEQEDPIEQMELLKHVELMERHGARRSFVVKWTIRLLKKALKKGLWPLAKKLIRKLIKMGVARGVLSAILKMFPGGSELLPTESPTSRNNAHESNALRQEDASEFSLSSYIRKTF